MPGDSEFHSIIPHYFSNLLFIDYFPKVLIMMQISGLEPSSCMLKCKRGYYIGATVFLSYSWKFSLYFLNCSATCNYFYDCIVSLHLINFSENSTIIKSVSLPFWNCSGKYTTIKMSVCKLLCLTYCCTTIKMIY